MSWRRKRIKKGVPQDIQDDTRLGLYEAATGLCGPQRPADPTPYLPALQAAILRYCRVFGKRPPNLHPETWT